MRMPYLILVVCEFWTRPIWLVYQLVLRCRILCKCFRL
jgi:hypothetical protein